MYVGSYLLTCSLRRASWHYTLIVWPLSVSAPPAGSSRQTGCDVEGWAEWRPSPSYCTCLPVLAYLYLKFHGVAVDRLKVVERQALLGLLFCRRKEAAVRHLHGWHWDPRQTAVCTCLLHTNNSHTNHTSRSLAFLKEATINMLFHLLNCFIQVQFESSNITNTSNVFQGSIFGITTHNT